MEVLIYQGWTVLEFTSCLNTKLKQNAISEYQYAKSYFSEFSHIGVDFHILIIMHLHMLGGPAIYTFLIW